MKITKRKERLFAIPKDNGPIIEPYHRPNEKPKTIHKVISFRSDLPKRR